MNYQIEKKPQRDRMGAARSKGKKGSSTPFAEVDDIDDDERFQVRLFPFYSVNNWFAYITFYQ